MASPVDIRPDHLHIVRDVLRDHLPAGVKVWVFGSRARWSARDGSDLDLALEGKTELDSEVMDALADAFEDSGLPYTVDLVDINRISKRFRQIVESHKAPLPTRTRQSESEWIETRLGEVIELKRGYDLPQRKRELGSVPIVSSSGVTDYHSEAKVVGPGVVTGRYGTLGKVFFMASDFWPLNTTLYVRDFKGHDPRFISYFLRILDFLAYSDKAAVPGINRNHLHEAAVSLPKDIREQRAIAHTLGTLDDRIELNRRMNETLEEMARALFKSWFVDFDPVRAKIDGRWQRGESLPGLPAEFYELFPERMVSSELGNIPAGWQVKTVGDLAAITGGSTPSTKTAEYWDGGTHCWATPKDLATLSVPVVLDTERKITDKGLNRIGSGLQPPGTVLLSSRAPIGYLAISEIPVAINQGFIAMQPKHGIPNLFLLHWCDSFLADILNYANGSTFLEVSKSSFRGIPIVEPSEPVLARYRELASSLHQKLVANEKSTRTLSTQRDSLLPQLMSGRLKAY